jgi:hypothetical protein
MPPRTGTSRSARFGKKEDSLAVSLPLDAGESMEFRVTKLTTSGTDEEVRKALATEVGQ